MELPTYTSIWRIEKRLYKLYDFRLPMPLPVGQIAAFTAITVPYVLLLTLFGLPFSHTLFWLYVLPPGALTWLATRPVLESKRLPELIASQLRYLQEPSDWCRMAPLAERDEIIVYGRVWRRGQPAAVLAASEAAEISGGQDSAVAAARGAVAVGWPDAVGWPEPAVGWPGAAARRVDPAVGRPERVMGRPEAVVGRSEPVVGRPEPVVGRPEPAVERPGREPAPGTYRAGQWWPGTQAPGWAPQPGQPAPGQARAIPPAPPKHAGRHESGRPGQARARGAAPVWPEAAAGTTWQRGAAGPPAAAAGPARPGFAPPRPAVPADPVWPRGVEVTTAHPAGGGSRAPEAGGAPHQAPSATAAAASAGVPRAAAEPGSAGQPAAASVAPAARQQAATPVAAAAAPIHPAPAAAAPIHPGPAVPAPIHPAPAAPAPIHPGPAAPALPPQPPVVERALSGPRDRPASGWRARVRIIPGGHGPGRPDPAQEATARALLPLGRPRLAVVLGCTVGAGQTVTALMLADLLARVRGEPVAALDLNPGPASLTELAGVPALAASALLGPRMPTGQPGPAAASPLADSAHRDQGPQREARGAATRADVIRDDPAFTGGAVPLAAAVNGRLGRLVEVLASRYPLTVADPGAAAVARVLPAADQLVLVAPASADAARAVGMTLEWLGANGHGELAARSVVVLNGVSQRTVQHAEQAELVARGRCRAMVRVPWDDHLAEPGTERGIRDSPAAGAPPGLDRLRPAVLTAYTALAGVVVSALASPGERDRAAQ